MIDDPHRSDRPNSTDDFHEQDWLIVCEALARWAADPSDVERLADPRKARAFDLLGVIADDLDVPEGDLLEQVDEDWPARERE
jgi:hypothetical protein